METRRHKEEIFSFSYLSNLSQHSRDLQAWPTKGSLATATIARHISGIAPQERQSLAQGAPPWDGLLGAFVPLW